MSIIGIFNGNKKGKHPKKVGHITDLRDFHDFYHDPADVMRYILIALITFLRDGQPLFKKMYPNCYFSITHVCVSLNLNNPGYFSIHLDSLGGVWMRVKKGQPQIRKNRIHWPGLSQLDIITVIIYC